MSPRHKKPRKCGCPFGKLKGHIFKPSGIPMTALEHITLFRDELEALRLCDFEDMTQEEAGEQMGVSRGTVHRLLMSGRKKLVEAIVSSKAVIFEPETNVQN
jgi:predicted DNA-binding protein (UPF0251 family)